MKSIGILWMQYGPYHIARALALQELARPVRVHALELANQSRNYAWTRSAKSIELATLCPNKVSENLSFREVFKRARQRLNELNIETCLIPSYSPSQPLAALLAAKSLGIKTVMMNESHAGTARAGRVGTWMKRRLVSLFDAALVGGAPQKRYYASLGLPEERIFTGYNAVDNNYHAAKAEEIRRQASMFRKQYDLPEHYFLNVGRFVAKKNLRTLIQAYRHFLDSQSQTETHLVLVGAGEEEANLHSLCGELKLPVYEKQTETGSRKSEIGNQPPGVHFYGFRQIEENPVFYALADAFVLPSLYEEWGLVVNEAMASGLPVVVSNTAGCAEDLLENAGQPGMDWRNFLDLGRREAIKRGLRRNGFVFDPHSANELATIFQILAAEPEARLRMGAASRIIVEKFSCRNFAVNALEAIRAAMSRKTEPKWAINNSQASV